ncbi:hypothetical protein CLAIMM_10914 isoform 1, partial [Cladophialophora immunda]
LSKPSQPLQPLQPHFSLTPPMAQSSLIIISASKHVPPLLLTFIRRIYNTAQSAFVGRDAPFVSDHPWCMGSKQSTPRSVQRRKVLTYVNCHLPPFPLHMLHPFSTRYRAMISPKEEPLDLSPGLELRSIWQGDYCASSQNLFQVVSVFRFIDSLLTSGFLLGERTEWSVHIC